MFTFIGIRQKNSSKISLKNFSSFFYNFGNDVSNKKINNFSNPKIISELKFAYKNFIESIYDKDLE